MMAFARWNLACCELPGMKETARYENPMLGKSVIMFWEWTCSKFPICLNFCGTTFLQQKPESYWEVSLVTPYRAYTRASPCMAYVVWSLNSFIFLISKVFKKVRIAQQPCSSSSFALHLYFTPLSFAWSHRCSNEENLLLCSFLKD